MERRRWNKDQLDSLEAAEMTKPPIRPRHEMNSRSGLHLVGIIAMIIVVGRVLQVPLRCVLKERKKRKNEFFFFPFCKQMIFAASLGISSSIGNEEKPFPVSDQLDSESIKAFVRHEVFHLGVFTTVWQRPEITTVVRILFFSIFAVTLFFLKKKRNGIFRVAHTPVFSCLEYRMSIFGGKDRPTSRDLPLETH